MQDYSILEVFNQYLSGFSIFIDALFTRMEFARGVSIGAIILIIAVFSIVIGALYGMIRSSK